MAMLTGRVLYPGDPGWNGARTDFNQRFEIEPRVIVFAQHAADVVNAVNWARINKVPVRARSGRHSYEGYSLVADGLVIDVSELDTVTVDREAGTATVGAGIDMLHLSETLGEVGVIIPLATGPTVGLAGLTLGGGFGLTSRKLGLTCDNLLSLEMVDAGGNLIQASENHHSDLFWACRGGGGGNFGIVTSFTFKVHPIGLVSAFSLQWPWSQFESVVQAWQEWTADVDEDITTALQLTVEGTVKLYGLYCPDDPAKLPLLSRLVAPLLENTTPMSTAFQTLPYTVAARMFFQEGTEHVDPQAPRWTVHVHSDQQIYKSSSAAALEPFSAAAVAQLKSHLETAPKLSVPPSEACMVQLLGGGGALSRLRPEDTAVYWRHARFIVQYDGFWTAPDDGRKIMDWVEQFRNDMLSYTEGAYVNYVDSRIAEPLEAYYGKNLERLRQVKKRYDPDNFFHFPQSIPPSS